jgi:DNA-binding MarR family transcriptional regulator
MRTRSKASDSQLLLLRTLAEFRYELRQFLHFSERAAVGAGLQPQQHQLLLQVAGAPEGEAVTIAYAAERLSLRHHSVVELVNRSEREGLLTRTVDTRDRRRAILQVTRKGERLLDRLAGDHARELKEMAPRLAKALKRIGMSAQDSAGSKTR